MTFMISTRSDTGTTIAIVGEFHRRRPARCAAAARAIVGARGTFIGIKRNLTQYVDTMGGWKIEPLCAHQRRPGRTAHEIEK
jgi:hypothetical protein